MTPRATLPRTRAATRGERPFRPLRGEHPVVQRVRVLEVGLEGGKPAVLFDGTPAQAKKLYAASFEALRRMMAGVATNSTACRRSPICTCDIDGYFRSLSTRSKS